MIHSEEGVAESRAIPAGEEVTDIQFVLALEGYEGPIDLLLSLARDQKVDLSRISILALADQYLDFIATARHLRLELAADYLVMAAWLAYLKSRLLLPEAEESEEPSGAELAAALAFQLQRLQAMQEAGQTLARLPRLGQQFFKRGAPETVETVRKVVYKDTLYDLLKAYAGHVKKKTPPALLHIPLLALYSMDDALQRLRQTIGVGPSEWRDLVSLLPLDAGSGLYRRSALASTFAASLELAREGLLQVRQDHPFGPIYIRPAETIRGASELD